MIDSKKEDKNVTPPNQKIEIKGEVLKPENLGITLKSKVNKLGKHPEYRDKGKQGFYIIAPIDAIIEPMERLSIPIGIQLTIPEGHILHVCSLKNLVAKRGVLCINVPEIPTEAKEEFNVILYNTGTVAFKVKTGYKIAQCFLQKTCAINLELS